MTRTTKGQRLCEQNNQGTHSSNTQSPCFDKAHSKCWQELPRLGWQKQRAGSPPSQWTHTHQHCDNTVEPQPRVTVERFNYATHRTELCDKGPSLQLKVTEHSREDRPVLPSTLTSQVRYTDSLAEQACRSCLAPWATSKITFRLDCPLCQCTESSCTARTMQQYQERYRDMPSSTP